MIEMTTLEKMRVWACEALGIDYVIANVRLRPQNMSKPNSHVVQHLRQLGYLEPDACYAVLWLYRGNGTRFPDYLGVFLRCRDDLSPENIIRGNYNRIAQGEFYDFYKLLDTA